MQYEDCVEWLASRGRSRIEPGLGRTQALLSRLGHRGDEIPGVLVAGTNGKGSTCAMAVAGLVAAGYRVGSMPSPHLQQYTERIRINGIPVGAEQFAEAVTAVQFAVDELDAAGINAATQFEIMACVAFSFFVRQGVDAVVLEVGMGGRDDATNVFDPGVKVITSIGLDHQEFLGDTLASVAWHKAGVIRAGDDVLIGDVRDEARKVITKVLDDCGGVRAQWMRCALTAEAAADGEVLVGNAVARHRALRPPLPGAHQQANLALAVGAVDALCARTGRLSPSDGQWARALAELRWPGRLELCTGADLGAGWNGSLLLDGAHNPHALRAVIPEAERLLGRPPVVVFAAMRDKALAEMVALIPRTWPLVVTTVEGERAAVPQALATLCTGHAIAGVADNPAQALGLAARAAAPDRPIVVLGSLFLVGAIRNHLNLPPA
ncbi:bifunctional folylpolyglutamate synthase/dihydrofolate synthase [Actinacidiphila oryziradicis]|uniref:tetrahydrofolate synthase n=1 Tax=Actinacidiphila oryziradicis TaxID=2571141 RepID=A0A4U0SK04_9ACTN|nr:Mur ligase family protein [Actinacidiphila oryziradicis]TKA09483.1 bifunctional folylpolyglutamate synthase/dihydrofolate synthase [Actinacidiphila oryziradicis]